MEDWKEEEAAGVGGERRRQTSGVGGEARRSRGLEEAGAWGSGAVTGGDGVGIFWG
jgi:hypothetical protein